MVFRAIMVNYCKPFFTEKNYVLKMDVQRLKLKNTVFLNFFHDSRDHN